VLLTIDRAECFAMDPLPESDAPPRRLTQEHWCALFADVAYVLPINDEGEVCYGIFAADGTPLAVAPSRALAICDRSMRTKK
jgi:hypothetical protein